MVGTWPTIRLPIGVKRAVTFQGRTVVKLRGGGTFIYILDWFLSLWAIKSYKINVMCFKNFLHQTIQEGRVGTTYSNYGVSLVSRGHFDIVCPNNQPFMNFQEFILEDSLRSSCYLQGKHGEIHSLCVAIAYLSQDQCESWPYRKIPWTIVVSIIHLE